MIFDAPLPNIRIYHKSVIEHEEIKKKIQGMVGKDFIRPSSSPCASPIISVPKKNGPWGMCVDFKVFDSFKHKIFTTPILALFDHKKPFEFKTDASGYAMVKETMVHIDHQLLQYLQSQTKLK